MTSLTRAYRINTKSTSPPELLPKGRLAEDGPIPERYSGLVETPSSEPAVRTSLNVRDSDATLIVSHGPLTGGSLLTLEEARRWRKPVLHLDLHEATPETAVASSVYGLILLIPAL
jgi:hypothetical protein